MHRTKSWWVAAIAATMVITAPLSEANADSKGMTAEEQSMMGSPSFLRGHPDLRWRIQGMERMDAGDAKRAMEYFKMAAEHADKPSQAMIANLLWTGADGVRKNRPEAYAWMDLAAERGYRDFVILRERFWADLSESEQEEALEVGQGVWEEYSDEVAKPRQAREMEKARNSLAGSRTGGLSTATLTIQGSDGMPMQVDAQWFFNDRYWKPDQYWEWADTLWREEREMQSNGD